MNVAVVEPATTHESVGSPRNPGLETTNSVSEWIDPEGDDWFSEIYRDLTQANVGAAAVTPELEHWFG
jgi:hypothetical protein